MMTGEATMLTIDRFWAGYGRRKIVEDLSLAPLRGGEVTALLGPNGAGKTTLLRGLSGLLPAGGTLRLGEVDLMRSGRARLVSYMPQALPSRVSLTVFEATFSALKAPGAPDVPGGEAKALVMDTLARLDIASLAFRPLAELSGGQRQMASLAQAVVRQPAVLLLDEPTSALDLNFQFRVMDVVRQIVRERNIVAVVVLHDIALGCRWCQRVVLMTDGRVVADGAPADAVTAKVLADVYGVRARVERCSQGSTQVIVDGVV